MTKRMLVDATHSEETRVALIDGNWLSDFDFERASKKQLKGNIYLAKVIRIEPSLQAAFVEYGGNRHGFLPFAEIHPDYFRIPVADRPPEEEADEGDEAETSPVEPAQVAAHQDEIQDQEELDHALPHTADETQPPSAFEPSSAENEAPASGSYNESQPVSEFGGTADNDLGLITDFGNAAVGGDPNSDPNSAPPPVSVETVGGEVADVAIHEERRRHPPRARYKIQEVIKRRQVMLIQVVKEERGNKGAALTTFLSLPGRYCVLMPNTEHGGGVSRKITSHQDRRRMKEILDQLEVPGGMAIILRTAGMEQEPAEIQRDLEYLLRLWNGIREQTLQSTAPALIYEEANLIKRAMRDLYSQNVDEVLVAGKTGYELAREFMNTIMPDEVQKIRLYEDSVPLFFRHNVEKQIDQLYNPIVQLRSGGYIVINPTEALVSIDVNSGKATRERHIESTALKTNLEAAEEIARQLRLRDLAGLIVIDFIDMEDGRNNASVERRMKEAMRTDRARLQIGRISPFGLLELSRQRLRPSLMEINFEKCAHCAGVGFVRSVDSAALSVLRLLEEEGIRKGGGDVTVHVASRIALFILNQKRHHLNEIERRYGLRVLLNGDDTLVPPDFRIERSRNNGERVEAAVNADQFRTGSNENAAPPTFVEPEEPVAPANDTSGGEAGEARYREGQSYHREGQRDGQRDGGGRRNRFGYGRGRGRDRDRERGDRNNHQQQQPQQPFPAQAEGSEAIGNVAETPYEGDDNIGNVPGAGGELQVPIDPTMNNNGEQRRGRRRGRRGGRGRRNGGPNDRGDRPHREHQGFGDRPRNDWGGDRNRSFDRPQNRNTNGYVPPVVGIPSGIPDGIPEIDTTPREQFSAPPSPPPQQHFTPTPARQTYEAPAPVERRPAPPRQAISSAPYEVVDQPTDKPKGGWWKKLTGQ